MFHLRCCSQRSFGFLHFFLITFSCSVFFSPTVGRSATANHGSTRVFKNAYHDGFCLILWDSTMPQEKVISLLKLIRKRTAASHLAIPWMATAERKTSSFIRGSYQQNTFAMSQARWAKKLGFSVSFFPLIWGGDGSWRGEFDPSDIDEWFQSYKNWIGPLVLQAQEIGATEVVVASEMNTLFKHDARWSELLRELHRITPLPLVMSVNHNNPPTPLLFEESDAIGFSAYFSMASDENLKMDVTNLTSTWYQHAQHLRQISKSFNKPIYISELGYLSTSQSLMRPWDFRQTENPLLNKNEIDQKNAFHAFYRVFAKDPLLVRTLIWAAGSLDEPNYERGYNPLLKIADQMLKLAFRARRDMVD